MISDVFELGINVVPKEAPTACDRSLSTKYSIIFEIPELKEQLEELKKFSYKLKK